MMKLARSRPLPVLLVVALALSACKSDVVSSQFADRGEATTAIAQGWLPSVLPPSAFDIREEHNLDTNTGHGSFQFLHAERAMFLHKLEPLSDAPALSCKLPWEEHKKSGASWYRHDSFFIAVSPVFPSAQFWLCADI